ncbi:hypothetical protein EMIT0P395_230021 [Pseudomonas sp. IT-P395]
MHGGEQGQAGSGEVSGRLHFLGGELIPGFTAPPVGVGLLAIAECQPTYASLTHRYREQAKAYKGNHVFWMFAECELDCTTCL